MFKSDSKSTGTVHKVERGVISENELALVLDTLKGIIGYIFISDHFRSFSIAK